MSLAISYAWGPVVDTAEGASQRVARMADLARALKFSTVDAPRSFVGSACDPARYDPHSVEFELVSRCVRLRLGGPGARMRGATTTVPAEVHFVRVIPGAGCEHALLGLRRFDGEGWDWKDHCVTQYASAPQHGGEDNFVATHVRLCELLRRLGNEGLSVEVGDDAEYWATRDVRRLLSSLRAARLVMGS